MGTIAEKLQKLVNTKEAIRQAIIGKGQSVAASDTFASYPAKIEAIQTGTDTSDATVTAADLRSGKVAYGKDGKVTGTVADVAIASPSILVSSSGLVTATTTQEAGFVAAGSQRKTLQIPTQAGQTYTPGTANQTIPSGRYLTGTQTILGDPNLVSSNIKKGVSIFGKAGTANVVTYQNAEISVYNYSSKYDIYVFYMTTDGSYSVGAVSAKDTVVFSTYVGAWVLFMEDSGDGVAYVNQMHCDGCDYFGPSALWCPAVAVTSTTASVRVGADVF